MAKVEGAYESVVRGVSQQTPHQRFSGQHNEQVNLLSDAVEGLVRRRGSRLQTEVQVSNMTAASLAVAQKYRTYKWNPGAAGDPLQVCYKAKNDTILDNDLLYVINQRTRGKVPVNVLNAAGDTKYQAARSNGIAAIASIGKYLFMSVNNSIGSVTAVDRYGATSNRTKVLAWIRGGAYARTFSLTFLLDSGGSLKVSYTTMSSAYPTAISYSGLPAVTDPTYQNELSKRVADYNSASTQWISNAAKDIQAENIASKLLNGPGTGAGTGNGLIATNAAATGINKITNLRYSLVSSTLYVQGDNIREIVVDDGGDGSLIRGVGNEVSSSDLVSVRHWYGKVVKVRAKKSDGSDAYYLEADNKNDSNDPAPGGTTTDSSPSISNTIRGEVVWKESAGYQQTLTSHFLFAYYHTDNQIYVSSSLTLLASTLSITTPTVQPNLSGDDFTNPPPNFGNKQITYLGVFQDRLVVGSGAVASFSRPGDYLNFFRQSVLTLTDNDPIDMFALGSEDDTLRFSVLFDKSLLLFGDKRQYIVNGRTVLTPINQNMTVLSQFPNTTGAAPYGSGNYIFYTKPGDTAQPVITLNQMQYGQIADSTDSYDLSQQLTDYCAGVCAEIIPITSPTAVIVRPETSNSLYIFRYTDEVGTGRRLQAAWDRWEFNGAFGTIISIATYNDDILMMVLRRAANGFTYLAVELVSLRPAKTDEPYMDSIFVPSAPASSTIGRAYIDNSPTMRDQIYMVIIGGTHALTGSTWAQRAQLTPTQIDGGTLQAGIPFDSYCIPTNPYERDNNGNAILNGRLTLTQVGVSVAETGGMDIYVQDANRRWLTKHFNGYIAGRVQTLVGSQPIRTLTVTGLIGREIRECQYELWSLKWLPMNITAISWNGQRFRR